MLTCIHDAFIKIINGISRESNRIRSEPEYNPETGIVTIPFEYIFYDEEKMKDPNKYDPKKCC